MRNPDDDESVGESSPLNCSRKPCRLTVDEFKRIRKANTVPLQMLRKLCEAGVVDREKCTLTIHNKTFVKIVCELVMETYSPKASIKERADKESDPKYWMKCLEDKFLNIVYVADTDNKNGGLVYKSTHKNLVGSGLVPLKNIGDPAGGFKWTAYKHFAGIDSWVIGISRNAANKSDVDRILGEDSAGYPVLPPKDDGTPKRPSYRKGFCNVQPPRTRRLEGEGEVVNALLSLMGTNGSGGGGVDDKGGSDV